MIDLTGPEQTIVLVIRKNGDFVLFYTLNTYS